MSDILIFLLLLAIRLINSLTVRTFFQPDEYWQALEPAHVQTFGYGYLTWEWRYGLRPGIVPMLYSAVYALADRLGLDPVLGPKIFQAVIAALGDLYTAKLAGKLARAKSSSSSAVAASGSTSQGSRRRRARRWGLVISVGSAFNWFCLTRTFSNTLETVLTCMALYYWPLIGKLTARKTKKFVVAVFLASLAIVCRPSNAILWALLGARLVWRTRALNALVLGLLIAGTVLVVNAGVDTLFYGRSLSTLLNFFEFNVLQSLSSFYGISQWHYYLTQGLPILLIGYLPFGCYTIYQFKNQSLVLSFLAMVATFSVLDHKEVRFIFPLLPVIHAYMAVVQTTAKRPRLILFFIVLINIPVAYFATYVHQRGVIDVTDFIRHDPSVHKVGFLMPCHSTPWQSHMHRRDLDESQSWFLTCEPPIGQTAAERLVYRDEADRFYDDIPGFIHENILSTHPDLWPSHLVAFEASEAPIMTALGDHYRVEKRFFNSYFHDDWRRKGDVLLMVRVD